MMGIFIREITLPKTVVSRNKIPFSDDAVLKCLFPKDTDFKQNIAPVAV